MPRPRLLVAALAALLLVPTVPALAHQGTPDDRSASTASPDAPGLGLQVVAGQLDRLGEQDGGVPTGALLGRAVVLLAGAALAVGVRRRRTAAGAPRAQAEAW